MKNKRLLSDLNPKFYFSGETNLSVSCVNILYMFRHTYSGFPEGSAVETLLAMQETQEMRVSSLGREDPLEEEMATHSCILA